MSLVVLLPILAQAFLKPSLLLKGKRQPWSSAGAGVFLFAGFGLDPKRPLRHCERGGTLNLKVIRSQACHATWDLK